jgi:DNA-binding winged helix-turn-helix (wHTH) protein
MLTGGSCSNVSRLRQKLGAAGGDAKLIETVPKRGYRFLPEVVRSEEKIVQRIVIEVTTTLDEAEAIAASYDLIGL